MIAMYILRTTSVAKISFSFHESGIGDGFTLSLEMVMMVPSFKMAIIKTMKGEKSNFHIRATSKKPNTIRIVMETA